MKLHVGLLAYALGFCMLADIAAAQSKDESPRNETQLPQQVIPTGEEDAAPAAAARSAVSADEEKQRLVDELVEMTDESGEGLEVVQGADGSSSVDLEGRFMSVAIAIPTEDGGYEVSCRSGEDAVAHAKHADDVASGKEPKAKAKQPAAKSNEPAVLEEK